MQNKKKQKKTTKKVWNLCSKPFLECRQTILKQNKLSDSAKNKIEFQYLNRFKKILKLSAVRKVLETLLFQALGIIESKTVWETVLA